MTPSPIVSGRVAKEKARVYPRQVINLEGKDLWRAFSGMTASRAERMEAAQEFSNAFSKKMGVPKTVLVSSARFALALALEGLGLKRGDEVILSAYGFHAMPNIIAAMGLKPVFADIRESDFTLDLESVRPLITRKAKALLATHIYGQPAEMDSLRDIAEDSGLALIEDCAEATGADYRGKPVGSIGDAGLFSFSMGKPLTGFGGGALTTSDRELAESLKGRVASLPEPGKAGLVKSLISYTHMLLSSHPRTFRYTTFPLLSLAGRLRSDLVDAALSGTRKKEVRLKTIPKEIRKQFPSGTAPVLLEHLERLDAMNQARIDVARVYDEVFEGSGKVLTAELSSRNRNIYNAYAIRLPTADQREMQRALLRKGIDTKQRHMYICSEMEMFREFRRRCPVAKRIGRELLHLPINHHMTKEDARYVAESVLSAF